MVALEGVIELLRPLVNNESWNYCVAWILRNDPSRFIEWGECCCNGGRSNVGVGITIPGGHTEECKDRLVKHPVRSDACMMLAQLPSVISLDSGIYGDVMMSNIPRWKTQDVGSSVPNAESKGTLVLIPFTWGLIELFSIKHVARDQKLIDFISSQCGVPIMLDSMWEHVQTNHQENWDPFLNLQPINDSSLEGFFPFPSSSNELEALLLAPDHDLTGMPPETSSKVHAGSPSRNKRLKRKKCADIALANVDEKASMKLKQKSEKRPSMKKKKKASIDRDPNAKVLREQNQRRMLNDGFLALRTLVPKITKMDKTSTLTDTTDYIKELEATIQNYRDELEALNGEDCEETNSQAGHPVLVRDDKGRENIPRVLGVEVNQRGAKDFWLTIECEQKPRAFSRLVQVVDSLGLQVTRANVFTHHGMVSHVLTVELKAMRPDLDETTLKNSLVLLLT